MKKNNSVTLSGEDFIHKLHADDILDIPEFYKAYMDRNEAINQPISRSRSSNPPTKKEPGEVRKTLGGLRRGRCVIT